MDHQEQMSGTGVAQEISLARRTCSGCELLGFVLAVTGTIGMLAGDGAALVPGLASAALGVALFVVGLRR